MSKSRVNTMIFFFDSCGTVHRDFVPPAQTVNHACYKDVLERLPKRVQRVRTDIADDRVPHDDNAPAHTALSIREFLAKKNIPVLPRPPYSPDPAPCEFTSSLSWNWIWSSFRDDGKRTESCNRWATHTYRKWLPVLLWSVETVV